MPDHDRSATRTLTKMKVRSLEDVEKARNAGSQVSIWGESCSANDNGASRNFRVVICTSDLISRQNQVESSTRPQ